MRTGNLEGGRSYEIRGYETFQNDRNCAHKAGCGVAMFIKRNLKYSVIHRDLPLEAQSIRLTTDAGHVVVTNVYWPKPASAEQCERNIEAMSHLFDNNDSIVVGDFNAKSPAWYDAVTDPQAFKIVRTGTVHDLLRFSECDQNRAKGSLHFTT
jgi:exonuclease III